ncbi:MAG: flagellin [Thermoplasmata archaeon]|nr:MAG: flagellin [Thermoplasmata archaeon]MCD6468492.1 flagellin [Thermoplasmata archaeon]
MVRNRVGKLRNNAGAIGIGAMIVFIAMVLVAGIAASVLIQTSSRLETQAMATGQETTNEVATGVAIADIEGYAATGSDISRLAIQVRPRAGSEDIDLSQAFVEISDSSKKLVLTYDSTEWHAKSEINGDVFQSGFFDDLDANEFGIVVLEDADSSCTSSTPVINRGDKVLITVDVGDASGFNSIAERTDVWGMVAPEDGAPGIISFRTPASYTDNVMDLQ